VRDVQTRLEGKRERLMAFDLKQERLALAIAYKALTSIELTKEA
jgi:hypothetical protein